MKKNLFKNYTIKLLTIFFLLFTQHGKSEPMIILEYAVEKEKITDIKSDNKFVNNEDFSAFHRIIKNETLSTIMEKYYGNSGLNLRFIQAAIVHKNKNVFVRSNPNFMFAGKKLYLPSINEIKNLVYKRIENKREKISDTKNADIYFFGN